MPHAMLHDDALDKQVAVTLKLDTKVYQAFLQKANKAGIEVEPYLTRTLSIVLGCRVFNETGKCVPLIPVVPCSGDKAE